MLEPPLSPKIGYNSVFNSMPKLAHSPNSSPRSGDDFDIDGLLEARAMAVAVLRGRQREASLVGEHAYQDLRLLLAAKVAFTMKKKEKKKPNDY